METSSQEEMMPSERFGVSSSLLEKARHLRDRIFPQAGVSLYIAQQQAYAVTTQQELVWIGSLQQLAEMSETEVLLALEQALSVTSPLKRSLRELRVEARFFSQPELVRFINEHFAPEGKKSIISLRTIWRAENGLPIAETTALVIVEALRARGVHITKEHVNWVIGHQGKRGASEEESNSSSRKKHSYRNHPK